jgi:phage baseplate assembly protein W
MVSGFDRPSWDQTYRRFTFELTMPGQGINVQQVPTTQAVSLFVNPENFTQTEPARVSVTQTKGGMFVDSFGQGIKTITIAGHLGYGLRSGAAVGGGQPISGAENFFLLRKLYRDWLDASTDPTKQAAMRFYNWADSESYEVAITQFTLQRAVGKPLLYQYNIQMTCINDLAQWKQTAPDTVISNLSDTMSRVRSALKSINDAIMTIDSYVTKGVSFFNSTTGTFQPAWDVVNSIGNLSNDITLLVSGATKFLTTPFDLVAQTITAVGDIASSLCSVSTIPGAVVRALRDVACAMKALPLSIFSGFTNPYLFEGASNCGTTLGIPDAVVANTSNSFTATALIPPQVSSSQVFAAPTTTLTLNEQPLNVTGVFLATDIEQTGLNYLASWTGRTITLTSTPSVPVAVYYTTQAPTSQNLITYQSSTAYTVIIGDSLQRIALNIYGDPTRWKEIALYNKLEYPYITDDLTFDKNIAATGTVRFYRTTGYTPAFDIPKGTLVYVPAYQGTNQINFYTTVDTTLPLAASYIDILVKAEDDGDIGNVQAGAIIGFDSTALPHVSNVYNLSGISGGKDWGVAIVGEVIQIPQTTRAAVSAVVPTQPGFMELFGIDIWVNDQGEFDTSVDQNVDFARVFGVTNLEQALEDRLKTGIGYYPYHSDYGSNLPYYIGKPGLPNQYDLIKTNTMGVVSRDPRISSIRSFLLNVDGDAVSVSFDAIPIGSQNSIPISLVV